MPHQLIFELQMRRIKILLSIFTITELTRTYGFGMRIGTWCSPVLNTYICVMVDSLGVTRTYALWYVQQQLLACRTHQLVYIRECIYQV